LISKLTEHLLLVEDDDVDAMMMQRAIRKLRPGLRVVRAANGIEALDMIAQDKPDLIVMDIRMPQMDGRETLAVLKQGESTCEIPVIMMSTSSAKDDVEFCYRNYSNAYMLKPASGDDSIAAVDKLLSFWFEAALISA